jgi:predicted CoA-binding protein
MSELDPLVGEFLAQKKIVVAGVSRTDVNAPANLIYRKLRGAGYRVFAVNPQADSVEGDRCFRDLRSLPEPVDAAVLATPAGTARALVEECFNAGIPRVWMHRSLGEGSVSDDAVQFCREKNMAVIPGGCPMMFCPPVDFGHKCMRWFLRLTGSLPR